MLLSLKEIPPSVPRGIKDTASLKKTLEGDVDWKNTKDILGWFVETEKGNLSQSSKHKDDLLYLIETAPTH